MKYSIFILLSAPFAFFLISSTENIAIASIHGENDIWQAPDDLNCLPWSYNQITGACAQKVDAQLNNLIQRTGMTYANGSQGSGLLVGRHCQWIISTKHTINHLNGKQRAPGNTHFIRNPLKSEPILLLNDDVKPINDLTDRKLTKIVKTATDKILRDCSEVPLLTTLGLKNNVQSIQSCVLINFNQDLGNRNAAKRSSMIFRTHEGLKPYSAKTRGITSCRITGFAFDGMIETDCDSVYASSGSPFFCKAQGNDEQWQLTGTLFADTCHGYSNYDNCLNPSKPGIEGHETLMIPITNTLSKALKNLHIK